MKTRLLILIGISIFTGVILLSSFSIQKDDQGYVLFCTHWIFSDRITCDVLWNESDSDSPATKNSASEDVADDFDKTWGGPGNRHPAFLGYEIADSCTDDMVKYLDRYTNIFSNDEHLVWNQAGLPEHVDKKQFDVCFEEQQKIRYGLVELGLTENTIQCEYGFKAVDDVCKQLGKIREKDIPIFFEIQLMEFDFQWELANRTWTNPDFEIEPPARICSHIIKDNGTELYISTIWQDEYSLSDMFTHRELPDDCVKILPVTEIAKNED